MNSAKTERQPRKFTDLSVIDNPIAAVLEAEAADRYCREQTYFDAIQIICNNFQKTPLLTIGKVFVNLSRRYSEGGRTDKALEILDGLAFILRQLEPKTGIFSEADVEVVHYECLLDREFARLGELRFARERAVNRIKELKQRRLEPLAALANEKCFETLDEIDALEPECSPAWERIKPVLRKLEQNKRFVKACNKPAEQSHKRVSNYLTSWQPLVLVSIMVLCAIAKGHLGQHLEQYLTHSQASSQVQHALMAPQQQY
jgi:hypothetical protein